MLFSKWLPWRFIIKRAAQAYGFMDPVTLMARLRQFGHPSEVHEPLELIRAGVVFHARGLVNTRAIQYNLDWIWPFWIVKQFKPNDTSFIPRGFSFSHVNLTHRNWTAVGDPGLPYYPIVDPAGLVTPYLDGWSIDFWVRSGSGDMLIPSEVGVAEQRLEMTDGSLSLVTRSEKAGMRLETTVWVAQAAQGPRTHIRAHAYSSNGGRLVLSLRPYNPEGIQFINQIEFAPDNHFVIDGQSRLDIDRSPEKTLFSDYAGGDVAHFLDQQASAKQSVRCDIGMATAAALFPLQDGQAVELGASLPLIATEETVPSRRSGSPTHDAQTWEQIIPQTARLAIPDDRYRFLYDAAVRTLLLLTADDVYPGPYTYKRFWFRDACLMVNALLGIGMIDRAERIILDFPQRQTVTGYFQSQEGEWDSNGQVLWIADRLRTLTGKRYDAAMLQSLFKGADWIAGKRLRKVRDQPHAGLLPAGFSAEHLGPNDYYYWDNFWGLAGLQAAVRLAESAGSHPKADGYRGQAQQYHRAIMQSIDSLTAKGSRGAIPASPYRRMDAGAIGSLVADYPLQLFPAGDPLIMKTVAYLQTNCFHDGAFFQDMIHSGINVYLTLAIAQTLLRSNAPGYRPLMDTVAELASPTGQWPEAIHPFTKGGCMGDGQHGWAAAEWLLMMRSLFVREDGNTLFIGSGIPSEWIESGRELSFGPTPVPGGTVRIRLRKDGPGVQLNLDGSGHDDDIEWVAAIPGFRTQAIADRSRTLILERL